MAVVSDIEIRLRADIARLQQDMTQARQSVSNAMAGIRSAVSAAATGIAALGAAIGAVAFAGFIKNAIDAIDAIGDISPATGLAIEDIAGLQLAFQFGGLEAKTLESTMIKLSSAIAKNDEAIVALGVRTRGAGAELRASKDVLYDLADAFSKMEDGTRKTALATEVFGKTGAALIPMLNGGSESLRKFAETAEKLGLTFTEEGVEAAGAFNDSLDILGLAAQGVGRQVAVQLLPHLNDLVGSFATLITEGNGVRKMADIIGYGFKTIYTGAVAVAQVFDTLSSIIAISLGAVMDGFGTAAKAIKLFIEGEYSQAWEVANTGATQLVNNAKTLGKDMAKSWGASFDAIGGVWNGTSGDIVEGFKKVKQATSESGNAAAVAAVQHGDAAEMQKAQAEFLKAAAEAQKKAYEDLARAQDDYSKGLEATSNILDDVLADAMKEAEANEEAARTYGMTKSQIEKLTIARIEDRLAQKYSLGLTLDEIDYLEKLLVAKKRNAVALADMEGLEKQKDLWQSIEETARDTFRSIADGGKGAAERLRDTFKNTFFDWLYQMTLKKWIIQLQPTTAGGGGLLDAASKALSSSGSGVAGFVQAGKTLYEGFAKSLSSSFGGVVSKAGELFGSKAAQTMGANMSSSTTAGPIAGAIIVGMMANNKFFKEGWQIDVADVIKSQFSSMFKGNGFAPIIATMTASMGIFEKAMKGLGVNAQFASMLSGSAVFARAFGRKQATVESQGIEGTISTSGFDGQAFAEMLAKGGWFRSDKRSTSTQALDAGQDSAFDATVKSVVDSVRGLGAALGLESSLIDGYSKQIKITLGKDEAENQKLIEAAFGGLADDLAALMLPTVAKFAQAGETASATLSRVANDFQAVNAVLTVLGITSEQAFGAVGVASIEARERLVALAGGVQAMAAQTDFFAANFLTEAQRLAPVQKMVTDQLASLGYAGVSTTDQFRDAVLGLAQSGALATEQGAKTYAGLLALAPAFKTVADAATESATAMATALAEANRPYEEQITTILRARMTEAELRAAETAGMDASTIALYDRVKALQAEDVAAEALRQAAQDAADAIKAAKESLDAINQSYQDQIDAILLARMTDEERRAAEIKGMDASTIALYDRLAALKAEDQALADAKQAAKDREAAQSAAVDAALAAVQRAVEAEKNLVTAAYQSAMSELQKHIDDINESIEGTRQLSQSLKSALGGMSVSGSDTASRRAAQDQIAAALQVAKRTGILPNADDLAGALAAVNRDSTNDFSSYADYIRDSARTVNDIAALSEITDRQLSIEERQLLVMMAEKDEATLRYNAQVDRLDKTLVAAQQQVEIMRGIDNSVLAVYEAVAGLQSALTGQGAVQTPQPAAWLGAATPTSQSSATMGGEAGSMLGVLQTIETRMRNVEDSTRKLSGQFDSVTRGGQAILTEPA